MNNGIVLVCKDRSDYLALCLQSIQHAKLYPGTRLLIIDDASTDQETLRLIREYDHPSCFVRKVFNTENQGIKKNLLFGFTHLFDMGCEVVMNIDGDALVRHDFQEKIVYRMGLHIGHVITGFGCETRNRNGSERHKVLERGLGYNLKASVGGINMAMDHHVFRRFMLPALEKSIAQGGNFDHMTCLNSEAAGHPIICLEPSVIQHIGVKSSMGHTSGGEPPDTAEGFFLHYLPNVTLIGVDGVNVQRLLKVADLSTAYIKFGAVKMLSHLPSSDPRVVPIRKITSREDYSRFMLKEIVDYIDTDYFLVVQHDGYIVNPFAWDDNFLNFDYTGAVWPWYNDKHQVGNGGFSLRSKRLHQVLKDDDAIVPKNDRHTKDFPEDHNICRIYRDYLEKHHGIKFASNDVANRFSMESWMNPDKKYKGSLGFHGGGIDFSNQHLFHKPY